MKISKWFSIGSKGGLIFRCADCENEFDLKFPFLDHHPGCCPVCGVECAFLDWRGKKIQIVIPNAPPKISEMIGWIQENLDELEYVELMADLETIADAVKASKEK